MPLRLEAKNPGFVADFAALVAAEREPVTAVAAAVTAIIADVRARGDAVLAELTAKFDGVDLDAAGWEIGPAELDAALNGLAPDLRAALDLAATRIRDFHERQKPTGNDATDAAGVRTGVRWSPVDAAGLYVPGGRAAYPSSVLMNAIPAVVAGVRDLIMVTPTPGGEANPLVLAAARVAGVSRVFRVGGAQAVAALAFGTARIPKVDVITGPGNAYVAEAKRQLYGVVGIDMVAGPSEVVIVSDGKSNPDWIAADLLAQAEHDPVAQSILITTSAAEADAVEAAVARQLETLPTAAVASASWRDHGAIIVIGDLAEALPLLDALAPEHAELMVDDPDWLFARMRHAGSVFLGRHTPEAAGDYLAGPNHVLPTGRRARFASGLSVVDFMKRTTFLDCGPAGLAAIGPAGAAIADVEGLAAHAASIRLRLG
ncbi:histidinol dehydrogenase [Sandarakinorhabdus cyanobacteriorum]|uniref:Histidinol dehydrogenase n=1 Tax=Sandarakinorhabdus cyanobacteriorum TaxID=1981098 RepID=A0A255YJE1_9SPHN|nr:histidinol dehydrogenase [Sandarakinorhabdus cyanobacteriorum]OYQ29289.1 histidinol dehydrogenase [Sandarakinorhabdus cyanobacteriorum]